MENIMEVIKKRKSIRAYKDHPLSEDVINSLLEAAKHAPTARNLQQLEYKVIINKVLIKKLSDAIQEIVKKENMPFPIRPHIFYNAPLLIIIIGPKSNAWVDTDAALAVQNIMLYATTIGLGTCFIGMSRLLGKDENMLRELHIPEDKRIGAAVICGYGDENPEDKEKSMTAELFK
ncbi:nitroreductase family protein [Chloroflexota bacterium]